MEFVLGVTGWSLQPGASKPIWRAWDNVIVRVEPSCGRDPIGTFNKIC